MERFASGVICPVSALPSVVRAGGAPVIVMKPILCVSLPVAHQQGHWDMGSTRTLGTSRTLRSRLSLVEAPCLCTDYLQGCAALGAWRTSRTELTPTRLSAVSPSRKPLLGSSWALTQTGGRAGKDAGTER